jgi:hypothetical protein
MRRNILSLFKRRAPAQLQPANSELSRTVIAAIDSAVIMVRALDDGDGRPRVAVQIGSRNAFNWNDESVDRFFRRMFPELCERGLTLAAERLALLVRYELRQKPLRPPEPDRRPALFMGTGAPWLDRI